MTGVANTPHFHEQTALACGLKQILAKLQERLEIEQPLVLYLAGGMAVHLYTGARVTTDIDAEFGARIALPADLWVEVSLEDGSRQTLYFDTDYNPMFALMHEDYQVDSIELHVDVPNIRVLVLSPLDLAVSKIARFADNDREDIESLARAGLISAIDVEQRATEALQGFVGGQAMLELNLRDAIALVREVASSNGSSID